MNKRGRKLTGKTKKIPISFTIEEHIADEFRQYCKDNGLSGSAYVQKCIEKFLKDIK